MTVHRDGVKKLLLNLKAGKAPGPDGFTKADLTLEIETDILTGVFQYSIDIGELPSPWNLANVVPICKAKKLPDCITYLHFMKVIRTYYCIT